MNATLVVRKIKWNADQETILNDAEASKLWSRAYRPPWKSGRTAPDW